MKKLIGVGGEACVFDIGRGRAMKIFKDAQHPDVACDAHLVAAANARIAEHQRKLPAMLQRTWPAEVVAPIELVQEQGAIAGYVMPLVKNAEPLTTKFGDAGALKILKALHVALGHVHRMGVVVGDLNPFNVLVTGDCVRIIDADSFQFDRFDCLLYTEKYTDPRLLGPAGLCRRYDTDADWYTFAALVLECLTRVAPFGGVHPTLKPSERLRQGVTVFDPSVKYPRAGVPLAQLPAPLFRYLRSVFVDGVRGEFPAHLLERLLPLSAPQPAAVAAHVEMTRVARPAAPARKVWWHDGGLFTEGPLGPMHLGDVLEPQLWIGPKFGAGFYRAGHKPVAFLFSTERRAVNDSLVLPRMPAILSVRTVLSDAMAVFVFHVREQGVLKTHSLCFDHTGARIAESDEDLGNAAAVGTTLLVPTDEGVVRMEPRGGQLAVTARFPTTRELVTSASRLHVGHGGLIVQNADEFFLVRIGDKK